MTLKIYLIERLLRTKHCVDELIKETGIDSQKIIGAGWATPGMVQQKNGVLVCSSVNYVSWHDEPIQKNLSSLLEMPVCIENHVRVRAIGQDMFERKERPDVYLYYFAQMGISCCVMADGEPFGKGRFGSGDIGHTIMEWDGPVCDCGKKGCLQAFIGEEPLFVRSEIFWKWERQKHFINFARNSKNRRSLKWRWQLIVVMKT